MTGLCGLLAHTAACTALGLAADLAPAAEPPAERAVVEVGTVSVRPVTIESWIPGSIVSRSDARIASVIAGRVVWIADVGTGSAPGRGPGPAR